MEGGKEFPASALGKIFHAAVVASSEKGSGVFERFLGRNRSYDGNNDREVIGENR
jgi:hypothetical protein